MTLVRVALDVPLDRLFDYLAPGAAAGDVGRRVQVEFGRRRLVGVVVEVGGASELPADKLRPVTRWLRDAPALPEELFALARFCADYYHHPLGEVLLNALPVRLRRLAPLPPGKPVAWRLTAAGAAELPRRLPPRAPAQHALLARLQNGPVSQTELNAGARRSLRQWAEAAWVEAAPADAAPAVADLAGPPLTVSQQAAEDALAAAPAGFSVWLLHGITGSGKTEVYLRQIARGLAAGRQALVLVPEINLTPQLEARFRQRFPGRRIVGLHSRLAEGERYDHWRQAATGEADIVLGTRLAVLTPLPRLGLIVVDEEHDASYKQQDGLRYSARDLAVVRGRQRDVPVLLGSATPSLESWHNAGAGRYRLLPLADRAVAGARLPTVRLIDLSRATGPLTRPLLAALRTRLERGEQSLLFLNRRGWAPVLLCGQCGWAAACPRCSARLTLHRGERRLRCHHCGHDSRIHAACPDCGNLDLSALGQGTQRLEEDLAAEFPGARIARVDRDSTRRKGSADALFEQVRGGAIDILVGTQMLAKGHDFPRITLVGVVNPDGALYSTDFRATEQLFAQLMQVAGRAGRADLPGEVLIQTAFAQHPLYAALRVHDYPAFAASLLEERRQAGFPPYCHQALLRAEAPLVDDALAFLAAARSLLPPSDAVEAFDPVPAQMLRLAGRERAQLLLQSNSRAGLQACLREWMPRLRARAERRVRWALEVDPADF